MQRFGFGVPEPHRVLLTELANLDDDAFEALRQALNESDKLRFMTQTEVVSRISSGYPAWGEGEADTFATALIGMTSAATSHGLTMAEFAESVCRSSDLELASDRRLVLAQRLRDLLSVPDILITGKAIDLSNEYERLLHTFRVTTDVRPVWTEDPTQEPAGGVITHQLRIDVLGSVEPSTFFIALDIEDLRRLRAMVDRAIAKDESLHNWFDRMGFEYFDLPSVEDGMSGSEADADVDS